MLPACTVAKIMMPNAVLNYSHVKLAGYKPVMAEKEKGKELFLKVFFLIMQTESPKIFQGIVVLNSHSCKF